jgi:hypothetical protein
MLRRDDPFDKCLLLLNPAGSGQATLTKYALKYGELGGASIIAYALLLSMDS